jgi:MYXO-CTERM domain-containing protein
VDLDCPNAACGGEVCVHSSGLSMCVPANTSGQSGVNDGWCASADGGAAVNSNCKCAAMGATCEGLFCTFTVPPGGGTGGSTGTGGSGTGTGGSGTGTGGTGTGGGGDGGCSIAGAPSLAGAGVGLALLAAALRRRRARQRV